MLGIFDYHLKDTDTETYYRTLADKLKSKAETPGISGIFPILLLSEPGPFPESRPGDPDKNRL